MVATFELLPTSGFSASIAGGNGSVYKIIEVSTPVTLTALQFPPGGGQAGAEVIPAVYANGASVAAATGPYTLIPAGNTGFTRCPLTTPLVLTPGNVYAIGFQLNSTTGNIATESNVANAAPTSLVAPGAPGLSFQYQTSYPGASGVILTGYSMMNQNNSGPPLQNTVVGSVAAHWSIGYEITSGIIPSLPGISVALSFTPPYATQSWVDVTTYLRDFKVSGGRQHELQVTQAGTATITLDNRDSRFTPWNSTGPYANLGNGLGPEVGVQITGSWNGITYPIFSGYIDSITPRWSSPMQLDIELSCTDLLGLLAINNMSSTAYQQAVAAAALLSSGNLVGPVFYWRCGDPPGNALVSDQSGNGYNEVVAPPGQFTFGGTGAMPINVGTSVALAGQSGSTAAGYWPFDARKLNAALGGTTSLIFNCWFMVAAGSVGVTLLNITSPNSTVVTQLQVRVTSAGVINVVSTGGGAAAIYGTGGFNDGNWHFLTVAIPPSGGTGGSGVWVDTVQQTYISGVNELPSTFAQSAATIGAYSNTITVNVQEVSLWTGNVASADPFAAMYTAGGGALLHVQQSGQAIVNGLSLIGVPATYASLVSAGGNIALGQSQVQPPGGGSLYTTSTHARNTSTAATTLTQTDGCTYAQTYGTAESGFLFVNPAGVLTLYDRHYPTPGTGTPAATSQATFEDASTSSLYYLIDSFVPAIDNLDLWNDFVGSVQEVTGSPVATGANQSYENIPSQSAYGKRSYPPLTDLLLTSDLSALGLCQWVGLQYGTPLFRVQSIKLTSFTAGMLTQMLGRQLWDQITVLYHGLLRGTVLNQPALIEGIDHDFNAANGEWQTVFHLSPAEVGNDFLILNNSTFGQLDEGNALAY